MVKKLLTGKTFLISTEYYRYMYQACQILIMYHLV